MKRIRFFILLLITLLSSTITVAALAGLEESSQVYMPVVQQPEMVEFRGLWVSRFDWTNYGQPADPAKIDEIVQNAAAAGFNVIFFQVRGTADAFYQPGPEPWAQRVSGGSLGQPPDPWWDPLAYFIQKAHENGLQLHAYLNIHPVWGCNDTPPATNPPHLYETLSQAYGPTNGLQWDDNGQVHCSGYQRASPAAEIANSHYLSVAQYLVENYALDGLHLDHIRYGAADTSCDPVSALAAGEPCFANPPAGYDSYEDWQRAQVDALVAAFNDEIIGNNPHLWLSAAVWPIHIERPEWGWGNYALEGYHDLYQDSKQWLVSGTIDSISPMIYPSSYNCPDNSFWSLARWQTLAADFQADQGERLVIPGIGAGYCSFEEIADRIAAGRALGLAGQAIFSYRGLLDNNYFDDLAAGPYAQPALVPTIDWRE